MISILYDPLFAVAYADGRTEKLGLIDLLSGAHRINELKANSCTGKLALLRLCIAFLCDAYRPEYPEDRAELLAAGCFERDDLLEYVAKCEQGGACFLLDDEKRPFMQAAYDEALDAKAEKPIAKIMFDRPGGNNHIHLDHRREDEHAVDTALAFEAMLETYMFCPAGLSGASNVNNTPPVFCLVNGRNLFETLVLNMVSEDEMGTIPFGDGEVAWTRRETIVPGTKAVQMSLLKALTWQPRRLTLRWDEDGCIRRVYLQNGLNFQGNGQWRDPHVLHRQTKEGLRVTVKPELGRALWRDSGMLIQATQSARRPIPLENIEAVWPDSPERLDVEMIGLITNQEAVLGRVEERLILPVQLFENPGVASEFCEALDNCELMYRAIDKAVKWQFCHPEDKKKRSALAWQAGEMFLHAMRGILFHGYLEWLLEDKPFAERVGKYMDAMWTALDESVLKDVIEKTGDDVPTIKRQNAVRNKIRKEYNILRERSCGVNG